MPITLSAGQKTAQTWPEGFSASLLMELYKPKVLMAAHHDDLYPVFLDMATEPLKMAVSHLLPGTETVTPVYLEPISMDISTGRVVENQG